MAAMGMTGILCGLSAERRRLVTEEPALVHELGDRHLEVPGRLLFDALRLPTRLADRLDRHEALRALLEARLGHGIGQKGGWAYGRPRIVEAAELDAVAAELDGLPEDSTQTAARKADPDLDPIDDEIAEQDDAFLVRLRTLVTRERARSGAILVHVT
jgi:hypothetical protein